jgi:hypothetical protein
MFPGFRLSLSALAALAIKLVHRRWMGDLCVVDFPSLLLVPMLECIVQTSSSAI